MVEIGGKPILWHIMNTYAHYGFNEFVVLLGYKGYYIKEYFYNYFLHQSDFTIDLATHDMQIHDNYSEPWKVTLLDTGLHTMTGGRVKRAQAHVGDEPFMLTYGDGVADIDVAELLKFHRQHGKSVTMTSVRPAGRFGSLDTDPDMKVNSFIEKPKGGGSWINGGFFVCEPKVFDYIASGPEGNAVMFEHAPLEKLAHDGELYTYRHEGFWQCMDTLADRNKLNSLWESGQARWKVDGKKALVNS